MEYRLLLAECDPTPVRVPTVATVEGDNVQGAIAQFASQNCMSVDAVDDKQAWLTLQDGACVRYLMSGDDPEHL